MFFKKITTKKNKANNNPSTSIVTFRQRRVIFFVVGVTTSMSVDQPPVEIARRRHFERSARIFVIEPFHDIAGSLVFGVGKCQRIHGLKHRGEIFAFCNLTNKKHEHDLSTDRWKPMTSLSLKGFKGGFNKHIRLSNQSTIDLVA